MARHKSAEKRNRQSRRQTERNRSRRNRIRTFIKKVENAIASGERALAEQAFLLAQPEIHRGVTRGIFHRNTGARKLSRLSSRVGALKSRTESKPVAS